MYLDLGKIEEESNISLNQVHMDLIEVWQGIQKLVEEEDPLKFENCDRKCWACHRIRPKFESGSVYLSVASLVVLSFAKQHFFWACHDRQTIIISALVLDEHVHHLPFTMRCEHEKVPYSPLFELFFRNTKNRYHRD